MKVQQKLSEEIRKGDIDLEIKLIDKYQTLTDNIIAKLKIAPNMIDSEAVLIKALEEYNTDRIFSLYILDKIKEQFDIVFDIVFSFWINFVSSSFVIKFKPLEATLEGEKAFSICFISLYLDK